MAHANIFRRTRHKLRKAARTAGRAEMLQKLVDRVPLDCREWLDQFARNQPAYR